MLAYANTELQPEDGTEEVGTVMREPMWQRLERELGAYIKQAKRRERKLREANLPAEAERNNGRAIGASDALRILHGEDWRSAFLPWDGPFEEVCDAD